MRMRSYVIEEDAPASESGLPWDDIETPPEWEELLILCIDTSVSMQNPHNPSLPNWSRTHEIVRHIFDPQGIGDGLYQTLEQSQGRQRFWTCLLTFADTVRVIFPPTKLVSPDGAKVSRPDFVSDVNVRTLLTDYRVGTAIGSALKLAYETALQWIADATGLRRLMTIAIVSDGKAYKDPVDAVKYARALNQQQKLAAKGRRPQIVIATAGYGHDDTDQADWEALEAMATPGFFIIAANGAKLRTFLEASMPVGG